MKNSKSPHWSTYLTLVLLLATCVALIAIQVTTANTATKLESTLFNVIQFSVSIAFSWILSKLITEQQFLESQKKFAIGAFRRILEIERSLKRTQNYISSAKSTPPQELSSRLDAINISLINAQDTVRSSIADWSDIIGNEIEVTTEILRLKNSRQTTDPDLEQNPPSQGNNEPTIKEEIERLESSLPAEIRVSISQDENQSLERGIQHLSDSWDSENNLFLTCFWEPCDSFKTSLENMKPGETISIARGITSNRNGVFLTYNNAGEWFGVVTNPLSEHGFGYDDFIYIFEDFYGRKLLPESFGGQALVAKITHIAEFDEKSERQYFQICVSKRPDFKYWKSKQ